MEKNEIKQLTANQAAGAKLASRKLALLANDQKNKILAAIASVLKKQASEILFQNEIDVEAAKEAKLSEALIDRLTLNENRIEEMIRGVMEVASLEDPIGTIIADWTVPAGMQIQKIRVPLGTICMIYESRPNVTIDATALCLKSGNAVILKGGSEAINTNHALVHAILPAAKEAGLPDGAIQFIGTTDREAVLDLIKLDNLIDLVIARGGEEMVRFIRQNSIVPVLAHGKGLCHTYIDKSAQIDMATKISINAKCQRPGVCNAMETLLVHKDIAQKFLPIVCGLYAKAGTQIRGCEITKKIVPQVIEATEEDWSSEYLDNIISIKVVESIDEAIHHINKYGSGHSEAIITDDKEAAQKFLKEVDAAAVFHNASTRLHDGWVFGFGSELGISTQKLHARGTMGIKEITTTKYIVYGSGQVR